MAAIFNGVGAHWGVSSTTCTAFGTFKLQSRDHKKKSETEMVKDADGVTVSKIFFDPSQEATFEYIPTSATATGSVTPTMPAIGDKLTVADTIYPISASNWLVDEVSTKSSNTSVMKVTVQLSQYPQIT
jgi:hypothetical protein